MSICLKKEMGDKLKYELVTYFILCIKVYLLSILHILFSIIFAMQINKILLIWYMYFLKMLDVIY